MLTDGTQICQFCYNNVKNNMNGLCPACRRPYDDKDIEYKVITPEESAAHKARQAQKQKKTAAALQKEKQKAEADNLSRKHLAGLRVVQKNLVYVTGLAPTSQEDQLLATLRTDQYFGQYGKIIKIVVSKAKDPVHEHSVGVYVTYERKEDAQLCINMVNGSKNGDRTLRAQFGTTKYCSAYLRGETCMNRSCMFLHEPGEANDSYSRADLSALNAGGSQHGHGRAPPQSQQPVAASSHSQPMARQGSDQTNSPGSTRPALASTSSWAAPKPVKTESRFVSDVVESPAPEAAPSQPEEPAPTPAPAPAEETLPPPQPAPQIQPTRRARSPDPLFSLLKNFDVNGFKFVYSDEALSEEERKIVNSYPPLFDVNIGVKRRQRMKDEEARRLQQEAQTFQPPPGLGGNDGGAVSGSLQLGGEPEEGQDQSQPQNAMQQTGSDGLLDQRFQFGGISSPAGLSDRGLTPQQHQQLLLQTMKSPSAQGSYLNNMNQASSFQQQQSNPPGHQRNASRYSFANESSASTSVKPVANAKLMNQQSSMMPQQSGGSSHFNTGQQQQSPHFFTSNVQGPPPGLKTTGTPPVSGGMTFGQGHGFATGGLQYGGLGSAGANRNNQNEELMRSLMRTQREGGADKREYSPFLNMQQHGSVSGGHGFPTGAQGPPSYASLSSYSGEEKQRKKKGKKHRHGNASSSSAGLGGDMDASAPPQILQSRFQPGFAGMHHGSYGGGRW